MYLYCTMYIAIYIARLLHNTYIYRYIFWIAYIHKYKLFTEYKYMFLESVYMYIIMRIYIVFCNRILSFCVVIQKIWVFLTHVFVSSCSVSLSQSLVYSSSNMYSPIPVKLFITYYLNIWFFWFFLPLSKLCSPSQGRQLLKQFDFPSVSSPL